MTKLSTLRKLPYRERAAWARAHRITAFDTSIEAMKQLKASGVPDGVILR